MDFVRVLLYIDYNPVFAGMVEKPEQWKYGGLWHHKKGLTEILDTVDRSFYFSDHQLLSDDHKIAEI